MVSADGGGVGPLSVARVWRDVALYSCTPYLVSSFAKMDSNGWRELQKQVDASLQIGKMGARREPRHQPITEAELLPSH